MKARSPTLPCSSVAPWRVVIAEGAGLLHLSHGVLEVDVSTDLSEKRRGEHRKMSKGVEVCSGLVYTAVTQESSGETFPGLAYTAVTQESGRQGFGVSLFSPGSMT